MTDSNKRIIFMGTPDYATIIFEKLLEENYNIVALFTQPDKPVGRTQELTPPHIKKFALENGLSLPIYQPNSLKEKAVILNIKELNPDIIIVAAYGQILPKDILDIAPCINLHASLLPLYRGASPIQQSLLNDDKYTGVTAMFMDVGLDSGDILGLKYLQIKPNMVVSELFDELSQVASSLTIELLENYSDIIPKKQNLSLVSHCGKVKKTDGLVDFTDAKIFYNKYRAYKSWPDIYLESKLKIKECNIVDNNSINKPGEILEINKNSIIVGCLKGKIEIIDVQPASKKQMNIVDYIRGKRLEVADCLS
ncbi:MAG: methionyl-tRNA formyltransferase [Campylobacterota bacterium]|nr:methionyl-tRNA formyltransferase [Campylobacterota bacterium]